MSKDMIIEQLELEAELEAEEKEKKGKKEKKKIGLTQVFPNITANEYKTTGKKISSDDFAIMKKLVQKYGDNVKVTLAFI